MASRQRSYSWAFASLCVCSVESVAASLNLFACDLLGVRKWGELLFQFQNRCKQIAKLCNSRDDIPGLKGDRRGLFGAGGSRDFFPGQRSRDGWKILSPQ